MSAAEPETESKKRKEPDTSEAKAADAEAPAVDVPSAKKAKTEDGGSAAAAAEVDRDAVGKLLAFYFGDSNFRHDGFLQAEAGKNSEGYVKLDVLLTFNRLKQLTTDRTVVAEIVAEHEATKELLALNEAKDMVRRTQALGEDDSKARTAFVSGFQHGEGTAEPEVDALIAFFQTWGEVQYVRKRRGTTTRDRSVPKRFLGEVFVEYAKPESVAACVAVSNAVGLTLNEQKLSATPLEDWLAANAANKKAKKGGGGGGDGGGAAEASDAAAAEQEVKYDEGVIVKVESVPTEGEIDREKLSKLFGEYGTVKYVDFKRGDTLAYLRFSAADEAAAALAALADGLDFQIEGVSDKASVSLLAGEDEKAYWTKVVSGRKDKRRNDGKNNRHNNKRGKRS